MDLPAERKELLKRDADWAALASRGADVETIVSYWTDDAIVLPPGQPAITGKAALREYVLNSLQIPGFNITWKATDAVLSPDGKLAYLMGDNRITLQGPAGKPVAIAGRAVTVWRKEPDGQWRCAIDIWNEPPAV
jgi:ketosteroid isomerase-like protein